MRDRFIKWFTDFHAFLIRSSNGRLGGQLGTQSILILQTTGRKSGQPHSTPIAYFDYKGKYLLVGSNWGRQKQADWVLNLRKQPGAHIEVKGRSFAVGHGNQRRKNTTASGSLLPSATGRIPNTNR
jgi:deazaflavin-dependent oxidoreductase (nitroreductase family)